MVYEVVELECRRGGRRLGGGVESGISISFLFLGLVSCNSLVKEEGAYMLMKTFWRLETGMRG